MREEREPAINPGARGAFGLFGQALMVGLLITAVSLLVVTLPGALAAGVAHLRRFISAEDSRLSLFWADVRAATPGGVLVGAGALSLAGLLLLDIGMARTGALPGGAVVEVVTWVLVPLLIPALGCAALAVVAIPGRRRRRHDAG